VLAGRGPRPASTSAHPHSRRSGTHGAGRRDGRPTYGPTVNTPPAPAPSAQPAGPRFLTLDQVAEELQVSRFQVYVLVRDKTLIAVKIGGRGQWRIERSRLEAYIAGLYEQAQAYGPADLLGVRPDR